MLVLYTHRFSRKPEKLLLSLSLFLSLSPEHLVCIIQVLGSHSIGAAELKLLIGALRPLEGGELPTYYFRLQRALSIMASEIGRDGTVPLYYFDLRKDESVKLCIYTKI